MGGRRKRWDGGWNEWRTKMPWATRITTAAMNKNTTISKSVRRERKREQDWEWESQRKKCIHKNSDYGTYLRSTSPLVLFLLLAFVWRLWHLALFWGKSVRRGRGSNTDDSERQSKRNTQMVITVRTFTRHRLCVFLSLLCLAFCLALVTAWPCFGCKAYRRQ